MRLGATGGPPTVCVFLGLAHFYAADAHFGLGAVAVTTASGDGTEEGRRVGEKRKRAGEEANRGAEQTD